MNARARSRRGLGIMTCGVAAIACACACGHRGTDSAPPRVDEGVGIRIIKGVVSDLSQESVIRLDQRGSFACTGTLVAPNLVLTARHCVQEIGGNTECGSFMTSEPVTTLSVAMGQTAKPTGIMGKQMFVEKSIDACTTDLALLLLDADIPGAKISKLRFTPVKVGESAVTVGYGDDGTGEPATKREQRAGLAVDGVGPSVFQYKSKAGAIPVELAVGELVTGESTCQGDSGGPLFDAKGEIIAVTSRGVDDSCVDRPSIYSTVAAHEVLIRAAFAASGHPIDDPMLGASERPAIDAGAAPSSPPVAKEAPPMASASASVDTTVSDGCSVNSASSRSSANTSLPLAFAFIVAGSLRRSSRVRRRARPS